MMLARVVGKAVSVVKHPAYEARTLLVVQPLSTELTDRGKAIIAVDYVGAGEGDTVIVTFRPNTPAPSQGGSAAADTAQAEYRIERIVARVDARSLYRLIPSDTTAEAGVDPPAIHYVVGNEITISMVDGEVDNMDVQGQTRGVHLEPLSAATPDSLVLDTATVDTTSTAGRRDTVSAPRSTSDRRHPKRSEPSLPTTDPAALIEPWRHA